jgi:hypothetical protein
MSCGGLFREDRPNKMLRLTPSRLVAAFERTSGGWHGLVRQAVARGVTVSFRCGHNGHSLAYKTVPPFVSRRSLPCADLPFRWARLVSVRSARGTITARCDARRSRRRHRSDRGTASLRLELERRA